ncbi:MAG TPA: HAMP domain-containing protein, partial [Geobacteraceae bacterium]
MKIGITYRLFLAILAAASLAVVCMFFIMRMSIDRGFLHYINSLEQTRLVRLAERLEVNYAEEGSWEALRLAPDRWQRLVDTSLPEEEGPPAGRERRDEPPGPPPPGKETTADRPLPPQPGQGFELRVMLLDAGRRPVFAPATIPVTVELKPLRYRDHVVGYLGLLPRRQLSDIRQQRFVKQQKFALAAVAGMVVLVAAALSLPLANRLVRPIRALAAAANRMASGQFDARVAVTSTDELGQLARDFNELALSLEKNEQVRRQWVADISHELRTPLAVLRAEIEALQDGVRQLSP